MDRPTFTITRPLARHLLAHTGGRFFSATFKKRTDGSMRKMVGRVGVAPKNPSEKGRGYDPADHDLLTVYVPAVENYRNIPLDSLTEIRTLGAEFKVV